MTYHYKFLGICSYLDEELVRIVLLQLLAEYEIRGFVTQQMHTANGNYQAISYRIN